MALERVENVYTKEETDISSLYSMAVGPEIKYYQVPAYNDPSFLTSPLSHVWSLLGFRTETDYNLKNLSYPEGGFGGTSLERLPDAFWNTGMIMFTLPSDNRRVSINGQNIALYLPLNSAYTGMTSGMTATTLYSSFIYGQGKLEKNTRVLCAGTKMDSFRSEPEFQYTASFNIGYNYEPGENPNPAADYPFFYSGLVYLVSDTVYKTFSGATGSSLSWSTYYNQPNKYAAGARTIGFTPINTNYKGNGGYDIVGGLMFLNTGVGFIFDPNLVQGFSWPAISGDPTSITGGTFTSGQTIFNAADEDISEKLIVKIVAPPEQLVASSNPSYIEMGQTQDCGVAISAISLYDAQGHCLAQAKPSEAIIRDPNDYTIFNLELDVSGPIQDSLADSRGLLWNGTSAL